VDVDGALDGGVEIDDGVIAGVAAGEAWGRDLMADGEGEGLLFTGTGADAAVELAEGEIGGDGAWDGGVDIDDGVTAGAAAEGEIIGDGAWDGGVEIDDVATAGAAAGEPKEARGRDIGELTAEGDGEGALFIGTGGKEGDGNREDLGDDGGDRATVELRNSATKSIKTTLWEAIVERWRRMGILGLTRKFWSSDIVWKVIYL